MKHDFSKFGERVKTRRKELGITQKDLAKKLWSIEIYSHPNKTEKETNTHIENARKRVISYENDNVFPDNPDIYCRLCEYLDCDLNYLLGGMIYENGKLVECPPNPIEGEIEAQLHLSSIASSHLRIAVDSYTNDKINETSANSPQFHNFEIGKKAKLLFLQLLLENPDFWEEIAVAYFDHIVEREKSKVSPNESTAGFSHLDLSEIHTAKAQASLKKLFDTANESTFDELGIVQQK